MRRVSWPIERGDGPAFEHGGLCWAVEEVSASARFMIMRRPTGTEAGPEMLLGSGTEDSVSSAMAAAERMAARCSCQVHDAPASEWRA